MTIQEAIEKMSEFITMMFDRQTMTEREQEEIEKYKQEIKELKEALEKKYEKLDKIMNGYCWDFNRFQDTDLGKKILGLAKEYGVNLTK